MPLIQHVYPWDSQPQEAVGIDWDNPLAADAIFHINFANGNLADSIRSRVTSNLPLGVGALGSGRLLTPNVNSDLFVTPVINIGAPAGFTVLAAISNIGFNGNNSGLARGGTDSNGQTFVLFASSTGLPWVRSNWVDVLQPSSGYAVSPGENIILGFSVSSTNAIFATNGVVRHSSSFNVALESTFFSRFGMQMSEWETLTGVYHSFVVINRALNAAEMALATGLSSHWQLLAPRVQYVPTSSGVPMPTLGIPTFVPGSVTSSGFRPRFPATWA